MFFNTIEEENEYIKSSFPKQYANKVLDFQKNKNLRAFIPTNFNFNTKKAGKRSIFEFKKNLLEYIKNIACGNLIKSLIINDKVWDEDFKIHNEFIMELCKIVSYHQLNNTNNTHYNFQPNSNYKYIPINLDLIIKKYDSSLFHLNSHLYENIIEFCQKYPSTAIDIITQDHLFEPIYEYSVLPRIDDEQIKLASIIIINNPELISKFMGYNFNVLAHKFPIALNYISDESFSKLDFSNFYSIIPHLSEERRKIVADKILEEIDLKNYSKIHPLILSTIHWDFIKLKFII
jgi:hypothetical protein